jgi:hypothetical protein
MGHGSHALTSVHFPRYVDEKWSAASRASSQSARRTAETEKWVRSVVVLSWPSSIAACGAFPCSLTAVLTSVKTEAKAVEMCSVVRGAKFGFGKRSGVRTANVSGGWLASGVLGGCGKLAMDDDAVDAGVSLISCAGLLSGGGMLTV